MTVWKRRRQAILRAGAHNYRKMAGWINIFLFLCCGAHRLKGSPSVDKFIINRRGSKSAFNRGESPTVICGFSHTPRSLSLAILLWATCLCAKLYILLLLQQSFLYLSCCNGVYLCNRVYFI